MGFLGHCRKMLKDRLKVDFSVAGCRKVCYLWHCDCECHLFALRELKMQLCNVLSVC